MVPRDRLIIGEESLTLKDAYDILENEKKGENERERERGR